jgi:hypothetical protein
MRSDLEERAFNYARYRGPPPGLYHCRAGAHPGGGVTGAPVHNAAREMLWELSRALRRSAAAFPHDPRLHHRYRNLYRHAP